MYLDSKTHAEPIEIIYFLRFLSLDNMPSDSKLEILKNKLKEITQDQDKAPVWENALRDLTQLENVNNKQIDDKVKLLLANLPTSQLSETTLLIDNINLAYSCKVTDLASLIPDIRRLKLDVKTLRAVTDFEAFFKTHGITAFGERAKWKKLFDLNKQPIRSTRLDPSGVPSPTNPSTGVSHSTTPTHSFLHRTLVTPEAAVQSTEQFDLNDFCIKQDLPSLTDDIHRLKLDVKTLRAVTDFEAFFKTHGITVFGVKIKWRKLFNCLQNELNTKERLWILSPMEIKDDPSLEKPITKNPNDLGNALLDICTFLELTASICSPRIIGGNAHHPLWSSTLTILNQKGEVVVTLDATGTKKAEASENAIMMGIEKLRQIKNSKLTPETQKDDEPKSSHNRNPKKNM